MTDEKILYYYEKYIASQEETCYTFEEYKEYILEEHKKGYI